MSTKKNTSKVLIFLADIKISSIYWRTTLSDKPYWAFDRETYVLIHVNNNFFWTFENKKIQWWLVIFIGSYKSKLRIFWTMLDSKEALEVYQGYQSPFKVKFAPTKG